MHVELLQKNIIISANSLKHVDMVRRACDAASLKESLANEMIRAIVVSLFTC